jgi:PAS domain S-box-containing protein
MMRAVKDAGPWRIPFDRLLDESSQRRPDLAAPDLNALALVASGLGVWLLDFAGATSGVSRRLRVLLGYEHDEWPSDHPDHLFATLHPEDEARVMGDFEAHLEGLWPLDVECRLAVHDKSYRWFRLRGPRDLDEQGSVRMVAGTLEDVTESKRLAKQLHESESRFRSLFATLPLGIVVTGDGGEVLLANQAFRGLCSSQEVVLLPLGDAAPPNPDRPVVARLLRGDQGVDIPVLVRTVSLDDGSLLQVVEDDRPRRAAERRARDMQRALLDASRKAGIAEIATGVLHNIGNAMNSAVTSAHAASTLLAGSKSGTLEQLSRCAASSSQLREFLGDQVRGDAFCKLLAAVSDSMRDNETRLGAEIARLQRVLHHMGIIVAHQQDHARHAVLLEELVIDELIDEAIKMSKHLGQLGPDAVRIDCPKGEVLSLDRHALLQVVVNLIDNAAQAIVDARAPAPHIVIEAQISSGMLDISVSDNGVGMTEETRRRLFTHGFTTRRSGHGFGLHNAALLVQRAGGTLSAASAGPGHGSTFKLHFPAQLDLRPKNQGVVRPREASLGDQPSEC